MFVYLDSAMLETNRNIALTRTSSNICDVVAFAYAGYTMLAHFFPLETPGRLLSKPRLLTEWSSAECDSATRVASVAAQNTIARAMRDGADPPTRVRAHPERAIGLWEPTPPLFSANPTEPYSGEWKTLVIGNPSQLDLSPPPPPQSPGYQKAIDEVVLISSRLTTAQKDIAEKWNLGAGSVTPAGVWNMRLQKIVDGERLTTTKTMEIFAAVHVAMHDALIACSYVKYLYWTERPITAAIRQGKTEFKPVLVTPSFPAYPSGHACASGAAAEVISAYLPDRATEVKAFAAEAAESRVYGGIHFRFDVDEGLKLGHQVGDKVIKHFNAKP